MTGAQAKAVILGEGGLRDTMSGGTILLTATIKRSEAVEIGAGLAGSGIVLVDTPVSGGFPGAQGGTLTMMASAPEEVLASARPVMEAVSATIHHVGTEPGMGQTVKACLQSLIGSLFSATFEAAVLAAKAGVDGEAFLRVVSKLLGRVRRCEHGARGDPGRPLRRHGQPHQHDAQGSDDLDGAGGGAWRADAHCRVGHADLPRRADKVPRRRQLDLHPRDRGKSSARNCGARRSK